MPKRPSRIVAFLQNQWFKDPERVKAVIERTTEKERERGGKNAQEVREFYIKSFLFFGCLTGRRLRSALGEELCEKIVWEEVSREIGGVASSSFPPDIAHIRDVLRRHRPTHVIAFGSIAQSALTPLSRERVTWRLLTAPHPAARGSYTIEMLRKIPDLLGENG